jgi:hypothetical protein
MFFIEFGFKGERMANILGLFSNSRLMHNPKEIAQGCSPRLKLGNQLESKNYLLSSLPLYGINFARAVREGSVFHFRIACVLL